MLAACRLAGLSALEAYYAGLRVSAQFGAARSASGGPFVAKAERRAHRPIKKTEDDMLTRIATALVAACALIGPANAADNGKVIACVKQALAKMEATQDDYEAQVHQTEIELCVTVDPNRQKRLRWALTHQAE